MENRCGGQREQGADGGSRRGKDVGCGSKKRGVDVSVGQRDG